MFDLLLRGGSVVDGTGSPPFPADVGLSDGRIAAVGRLAGASAQRTIDVAGLIVCPGFVDMHAHSNIHLLAAPEARAKTMQGVVTEVIGQDGLSFAPVDETTMAAVRQQVAAWNGDPDLDYEWRSVAEYLAKFEAGTSVNVAYLIPHGTVRMLVMGTEERAPIPAEIAGMREQVRRGLEEGAVGLSTGLSYTPAMFAATDELVALCEELVPFGAFFSPHTRSYGKGVMESYAEMIEVAARSGAPLHLTHCQVSFAGNEGRAGELVEMIEAVDRERVEITTDSYCYVPGSTYLAAFLPAWAWVDGPEGVLELLSKDEAAERMRYEMEAEGTAGFHGMPIDWTTIRVGSVAGQANQICVGRGISDIAAEKGVEPWDEARRLMLEEKLSVSVLIFVGHEDNVRTIMTQPYHMGGSDGIMVGDNPHPRAWGTFARYLGRYGRDEGMFSWPEIVRKLTSLPNRRLGQWDRGIIRPGFWADVVAFDPETVSDTATFENPRQYPEGIPYVVVNGTLVKDDGKHTGALPGRVLRLAQGDRG